MLRLQMLVLTLVSTVAAAAARLPKAQDAFLRGEVAAEQEDYELAIKYFEQARAESPEDADILLRLALAHEKAGGRDVLAIAWYRSYLAASQGDPDASHLLTAVTESIVKLETQIEVSCRGLIRDARKTAGPYVPPFQAIPFNPATGQYGRFPPSNEKLYNLIARAEATAGDAEAAYDFCQQPNMQLIMPATDVEFITEGLVEAGHYDKARGLLRSDRNRQTADIFIAMDHVKHGRLKEATAQAGSVTSGFRAPEPLLRLAVALAWAGETSSASRLAGLLGYGPNEEKKPIIYCWIAARKASDGEMDKARQWLQRAEQAEKKHDYSDDGDGPKLYVAKAAAQAALGDRTAARGTTDKIGDPYIRALARRHIAISEGDRKSAEIQDWSAFALYYPKTTSYPFSAGREVLWNLDAYIEKAKGSDPKDTSEHLSHGAIHLAAGLRKINEKAFFWNSR